jgi:serine/threonine-protein kinase
MDDSGLTAEGRVLGTTDYVSPEQALGHDVNGQSDLYSLGIVFYEMLTGDVPFHGENQVAVAMKHVREDLPDVSKRRPEVSAGLATILDRMTCKDLRKRYPDALTLQADLEDALTRELSRTGRSTGEATAVLRTLPEGARRRLPLRLRRPLPIVGLIAVIAAIVVATVLLAKEGVDRTQRGTGQGTVKPDPGTRAVSVKRTSATAFDPLGDKEEHGSEQQLAVDRDPGTSWSTEGYQAGQLGKDGVGIYVDAEPGVDARSIAIDTPDPGWKVEIRVADGGSPPKDIDGWEKVAGGNVDSKRHRFRLNGDRHRYYLVWITGLAPGEQRVKIAEITLFAPRR